MRGESPTDVKGRSTSKSPSSPRNVPVSHARSSAESQSSTKSTESTYSAIRREERARQMGIDGKTYAYIFNFRTTPCVLFSQHRCTQGRPYTCTRAHYPKEVRRKPIAANGEWNYSPELCKHSSVTDCPKGKKCPLSHKYPQEDLYHPLRFRTSFCPAFPMCLQPHCPYAHLEEERREPLEPTFETSLVNSRSATTSQSTSPGVSLISPRIKSKELSAGKEEDTGEWTLKKLQSEMRDMLANETEEHLRCIFGFRVNICELAKTGSCPERTHSCFDVHPSMARRRRPYLHQGRFNYMPTRCRYILEDRDCPQREHCRFAHSTEEVIYHPSTFKTQACPYPVEKNGHCSRHGRWCAKAHGDEDTRVPVFEGGMEEIEHTPENLEQFKAPPKDREAEREYFMYHYKTKKCQGFPYNCQCDGLDYHRDKDRRRGQITYSPIACPNVKPFLNGDWRDPNVDCQGGRGALPRDADGKCEWNCEFCHTLLEMVFHPQVYKTSLCDNFDENGRWACAWKRRCAHAHGMDDLRDKATASETTKRALALAGANPSSSTGGRPASRPTSRPGTPKTPSHSSRGAPLKLDQPKSPSSSRAGPEPPSPASSTRQHSRSSRSNRNSRTPGLADSREEGGLGKALSVDPGNLRMQGRDSNRFVSKSGNSDNNSKSGSKDKEPPERQLSDSGSSLASNSSRGKRSSIFAALSSFGRRKKDSSAKLAGAQLGAAAVTESEVAGAAAAVTESEGSQGTGQGLHDQGSEGSGEGTEENGGDGEDGGEGGVGGGDGEGDGDDDGGGSGGSAGGSGGGGGQDGGGSDDEDKDGRKEQKKKSKKRSKKEKKQAKEAAAAVEEEQVEEAEPKIARPGDEDNNGEDEDEPEEGEEEADEYGDGDGDDSGDGPMEVATATFSGGATAGELEDAAAGGPPSARAGPSSAAVGHAAGGRDRPPADRSPPDNSSDQLDAALHNLAPSDSSPPMPSGRFPAAGGPPRKFDNEFGGRLSQTEAAGGAERASGASSDREEAGDLGGAAGLSRQGRDMADGWARLGSSHRAPQSLPPGSGSGDLVPTERERELMRERERDWDLPGSIGYYDSPPQGTDANGRVGRLAPRPMERGTTSRAAGSGPTDPAMGPSLEVDPKRILQIGTDSVRMHEGVLRSGGASLAVAVKVFHASHYDIAALLKEIDTLIARFRKKRAFVHYFSRVVLPDKSAVLLAMDVNCLCLRRENTMPPLGTDRHGNRITPLLTVGERLGRLPLPSLKTRLRWCKQIWSAIATLHNTGLSHGDLGADSIFVSQDENNVIVGDLCRPRQQRRSMAGSARTQRPENEVMIKDPTEDVFHAGWVTYCLLAAGEVDDRQSVPTAFPDAEMLAQLDPKVADVVQNTLLAPPKRRMTAAEVTDHLAFWSTDRRLRFLFSVATFLRDGSSRSAAGLAAVIEGLAPLVCPPEANGNWQSALPASLVQGLQLAWELSSTSGERVLLPRLNPTRLLHLLLALHLASRLLYLPVVEGSISCRLHTAFSLPHVANCRQPVPTTNVPLVSMALLHIVESYLPRLLVLLFRAIYPKYMHEPSFLHFFSSTAAAPGESSEPAGRVSRPQHRAGQGSKPIQSPPENSLSEGSELSVDSETVQNDTLASLLGLSSLAEATPDFWLKHALEVLRCPFQDPPHLLSQPITTPCCGRSFCRRCLPQYFSSLRIVSSGRPGRKQQWACVCSKLVSRDAAARLSRSSPSTVLMALVAEVGAAATAVLEKQEAAAAGGPVLDAASASSTAPSVSSSTAGALSSSSAAAISPPSASASSSGSTSSPSLPLTSVSSSSSSSSSASSASFSSASASASTASISSLSSSLSSSSTASAPATSSTSTNPSSSSSSSSSAIESSSSSAATPSLAFSSGSSFSAFLPPTSQPASSSGHSSPIMPPVFSSSSELTGASLQSGPSPSFRPFSSAFMPPPMNINTGPPSFNYSAPFLPSFAPASRQPAAPGSSAAAPPVGRSAPVRSGTPGSGGGGTYFHPMQQTASGMSAPREPAGLGRAPAGPAGLERSAFPAQDERDRDLTRYHQPRDRGADRNNSYTSSFYAAWARAEAQEAVENRRGGVPAASPGSGSGGGGADYPFGAPVRQPRMPGDRDPPRGFH